MYAGHVFSLRDRNIGSALVTWKKEFDTMRTLLSDEKLSNFPEDFVQFIGFTILTLRNMQVHKMSGISHWRITTKLSKSLKPLQSTLHKR